MDQPDYFSAARYEPPPKKPRSRVPFVLLGSVALLGLIGFAAFSLGGEALKFIKREEAAFEFSVPKAAVTAGKPWQWRELAALPGATKKQPRPEVVFADFNKDRQDDILLIDFTGGATIYQPDGKSSPVKGADFSRSITRFYAWDYDRDGVSELIPHAVVYSMLPNDGGWTFVKLPGGGGAYGSVFTSKDPTEPDYEMMLDQRGQATPVLDIRGGEVTHLPLADEDCQVLVGDADGDGKQEAFFRMDEVTTIYRAYGLAGTRASTYKLELKDRCTLVGDLDGSGRDRVVNYERPALAAYGKGDDRKQFDGWPDTCLPAALIDLNGDGVDEVIGVSSGFAYARHFAPETLPAPGTDIPLGSRREAEQKRRAFTTPSGGWFDVKSKKWTAFQFPDEDYRCNIFCGDPAEVAVGDFDADGSPEIALRPYLATAVYVFGLDGSLRHAEQFGEGAMDHGAVRRDKRSHLVVQTGSRLLIWP
jgi:hypothetical protein